MWEVESVVPGRLVMGRGTKRDYEALERFHYRGRRPATWAGVWVVRWEGRSDEATKRRSDEGKVVAVGVLSWPTLACGVRERVLGIGGMEQRERIAFINQNVRTISRVVVHPTFRSIGLAVKLVRCMLEECDTRWVEAMAVMGRVHPFFEKAGMRKVEQGGGRPVYFVWDKSDEGKLG